jgi:RNA polymerase sigma factor (sigma-70 family)
MVREMPASDRELIDSCLRGDQAAWTELIHRYQRLIYSVARKLCPQTEDCADVFQRVCLDLYQNLRQLRNDRTLPAWLITVTKRRAYAVLKDARKGVSIDDYEAEVNPQVDAVEKEFLLERAVDELPSRCRELVSLLYFDTAEPSYAEISDRLGMPVASIGPTRARCLEKLRKLIQG